MTKKMADYADALDDFGQARDFVLGGVWEELAHAPTFTLADGSQLRPLTAQTLLRRSDAEDGPHYAVITFSAVRNLSVTRHEPEPTWRTTPP